MKNKAPSFQFYPADWLNDIKLQSCKIASQGLLINLICLMHQSEKYGFLLINGKKNDKKVAKIVRLTPKKFSNLTEDLVENGVIQIDENGVYYCKRMVKDQALRETRRVAGKLGGNPNLLNQVDKQPCNQILTPSSSSSSSSSNITPMPAEIKNFVREFVDFITDAHGKLAPAQTGSLFEKSEDAVDKLIRIDKFELEYVKKVLYWGMEDDFWKDQIKSLAQIRKTGGNGVSKFKNIAAKMERTGKKFNGITRN